MLGFRLTIWNVNYFTDEQLQLLLECFILTKWYVNVVNAKIVLATAQAFYINYVDLKLKIIKKHLLR
ncbi:hypothetical protein [Clostridioides difficile]|uniref:hypothetical protein n=1 Tax=Clostridioides difficile TaxID=1496 RepID=UPI003A84ABE7